VRRFLLTFVLLVPAAILARGQVIEFESNGLKYQTLTRAGVTVMFATLPSNMKNFWIFQVAVSNGSRYNTTIDPEEFIFRREDGSTVKALPARQVVRRMLDKANRDDVIKMVNAYEIGLYGLQRIQSTNGYEQRRQTANGEFGGNKLKAAAAASAIALVKMKLNPAESTDGAIFYEIDKRSLGAGRLIVRVAGELFEFDPIIADHRNAISRYSGN
jgi:hypothetical protein